MYTDIYVIYIYRHSGRISKTRKKMGMKDYSTKCPAATQAPISRRDLAAEMTPRSGRGWLRLF